jgi:hypothetical protein
MGALSRKPARRLVAGLAGFALLGTGFVLSLPMVPGPGLLVVALALAVLATEFAWARWILRELRAREERTRSHPAVRERPVLEKILKTIGSILKRRPKTSLLKART